MKTTGKKCWTAITFEDEYELFTFSGWIPLRAIRYLLAERDLKRQNIRITYYEGLTTEIFTFEGLIKLP